MWSSEYLNAHNPQVIIKRDNRKRRGKSNLTIPVRVFDWKCEKLAAKWRTLTWCVPFESEKKNWWTMERNGMRTFFTMMNAVVRARVRVFIGSGREEGVRFGLVSLYCALLCPIQLRKFFLFIFTLNNIGNICSKNIGIIYLYGEGEKNKLYYLT